jgi:hypothetical protein
MKRPLLLPFVAVLAFTAGILATSAYRDRLAHRDATQEQLVAALDRAATAQLTLGIFEKKGIDGLSAWCHERLLESIGQAHSAIRAGASVHGQPVPHLTEAFRRATVSLRESGRDPAALARAEAVLAHLVADQVPSS